MPFEYSGFTVGSKDDLIDLIDSLGSIEITVECAGIFVEFLQYVLAIDRRRCDYRFRF